MNLLGAVHADSGADKSGQFGGFAALPLARKEAVLKIAQALGLQIPAPVGAYPGPARQIVEAGIGPVKGGRTGLSHRAGHAASRSPQTGVGPGRIARR